MSNPLWPYGLQPTRLLCPWDSPGKNTGVGCHFLLQRIFLTQESNPGLLHCRQLIYQLSYKGSICIAAAAAKSLQSCPTLCDPIDGSPPGSAVPGILQARTLEWVAISFSNAWKWKEEVKSLSRVRRFETPWTDCSLPGSSIHGIFQARVLEWSAIAFSNCCPANWFISTIFLNSIYMCINI